MPPPKVCAERRSADTDSSQPGSEKNGHEKTRLYRLGRVGDCGAPGDLGFENEGEKAGRGRPATFLHQLCGLVRFLHPLFHLVRCDIFYVSGDAPKMPKRVLDES